MKSHSVQRYRCLRDIVDLGGCVNNLSVCYLDQGNKMQYCSVLGELACPIVYFSERDFQVGPSWFQAPLRIIIYSSGTLADLIVPVTGHPKAICMATSILSGSPYLSLNSPAVFSVLDSQTPDKPRA